MTPDLSDAVTGVLATCVRATPALLERRALLRRCDQKFLLAPSAIVPLLDRVAATYAVVPAGDEYLAHYANLYFDTPDLQCFEDHRRGKRLRQKIRIRSYADRNVAFLEVKSRKNDLVTDKARFQIGYGTRTLDPSMHDFLAQRCAFSLSLVPTVEIDYRRIMLVGIASDERVTIDLGLTIDGDPRTAIGAVAIVEVKQPSRTTTTPIMDALRETALRPISISKYITALAGRPGMRLNRFRSSLRSVERIAHA